MPIILSSVGIVRVRFIRATNNLALATLGLKATPTVRRLTVPGQHGFIDLVDVVSQTDPDTGVAFFDLVATDDPDVNETFGWTITGDGWTGFSRTVQVPQTGGIVETITVQGASRPAVWLNQLADFTGPSGPTGGETATRTYVDDALDAHEAANDPHPQYALDTDVAGRLLPSSATDGQTIVRTGGAWVAGAASGGGGSATPDATTSVKGKTVLLGGTADAPTVPWSAVTDKPTIPEAYTDEQARDAVGAALASGAHTGITFTPDDAGDRINAVVTASGGASGDPLPEATAAPRTSAVAGSALLGKTNRADTSGGTFAQPAPLAVADGRFRWGWTAAPATNAVAPTLTVDTTGSPADVFVLADGTTATSIQARLPGQMLEFHAQITAAGQANRWLVVSDHQPRAALDIRHGRVWTPQQYGAVADGTTNDTAAFTAAYAAVVAAGGGTLLVPPGTYMATLTLTSQLPVHVVGWGAKLVPPANNTTLITLKQGFGVAIKGSRVDGFTLDNNGKTGCTGLRYEDVDGPSCSHLYIVGFATGVRFINVAAGAWNERTALYDSFIYNCTTGIGFTVSSGSMPSFNEIGLHNVGISGSATGIDQGAGADFTRTTWSNVSIWPAPNGTGVAFNGKLDRSRLDFGVEALTGITGITGVRVGSTYSSYADPSSHELRISLTGSFANQVVDNSPDGGIVWHDGTQFYASKYGQIKAAWKAGETNPRMKLNLDGLQLGSGSAAPGVKLQYWYDAFGRASGQWAFLDPMSVGTGVEPAGGMKLDVGGPMKLASGAAPAAPTGGGALFADANGVLMWQGPTGTASRLSMPTYTHLKQWVLGEAFRLVSATRDANSAIASASVEWPDGATGTFTTDTASTAFPGAIDAFHVTYVPTSGTTRTVTQTAVTRDATGAVTAQPALTIA